MIEPETSVIKETYLSRKPAQGSADMALISTAVIFLVSCIYWENVFGLSKELAAIPERIFEHHEYWRLVTGILVHADISHFLSNAIAITFFGYLLYGYFGPLVYPAMSLLLGAAVNYVSLLTYPPQVTLVGASGVVYLMASFWLTSYILIERRFTVAKRILRSAGFGMIMLLSSTFDPTVSYRTHAIGFAAGICFASVYFHYRKESIRKAEVVELE